MPLATLHLLSLRPNSTKAQFLQALLPQLSKPPLVISSVVRWIIRPSKIQTSQLLHPSCPWSILVIFEGNEALPPQLLSQHISDHWTTQVGIPSRLTKSFQNTNNKLLHPNPIPPIPATINLLSPQNANPNTSQDLELSPELIEWIKTFSKSHPGRNAVSMLNLLAFRPGMKDSYLQYGKAFAESIGSKRGGNAKLVGNVVPPPPSLQSQAPKSQDDAGGWDEFALAHYPTILHFADMLASTDYQDVNHQFRLPSLHDTCILCTSEIEIEALMQESKRASGARGGGSSKL